MTEYERKFNKLGIKINRLEGIKDISKIKIQ